MNKTLLYPSVLMLLGVLGILTYSNALHGPFMFDDRGFFDDAKKDPRNIPFFFIPDNDRLLNGASMGHDYYYRPLSHVIPMLSYLFFRNNVVGLHTVNLVLWVLASWTVFIFLNALLASPLLAGGTALLFLVHPINGVVVNYITAGVFALQVIFMLISLWFLLPKKVAATFLAKGSCYLFFLLALMCHETAMALPFYAMAVLIFGMQQSWRQALKTVLPLWVTLVVYFVWRLYFSSLSSGLLSHYGQFSMNIFEYAATEVKLMFWYAARLFFPLNVVMIYASPVLRGAAVWGWLILGAWLAALIIAGLRRCSKIFILGTVWFFIGFIPFLPASLFQPSRQVLLIEPHWFVFSSIGFFLIIAHLLRQWWDKSRLWASVIIMAVFMVLIVSSRWTNNIWADEILYGKYWLRQSPSFSAIHTLLGRAYQARGLFAQAREQMRLGLTSHPEDWFEYLMSAGLMDLDQGDLNAAEGEFNRALRLDRREAMVYNDIGAVYYKKGDMPQAQKYFEQALSLNARALLPRLNMGKVFLKMGHKEEAIRSFEEVLSRSPGNGAALNELASMGMDAQKSGDMVTAQRVYKLLMRIAPKGNPSL